MAELISDEKRIILLPVVVDAQIATGCHPGQVSPSRVDVALCLLII